MEKTGRDCRINESVIKEITEIPYRILKEQMDLGGVFPVKIPKMCTYTPKVKYYLASEFMKKQPEILKKYIKEGITAQRVRVIRKKKQNRGLL